MTVAELIEALAKLPPGLNVVQNTDQGLRKDLSIDNLLMFVIGGALLIDFECTDEDTIAPTIGEYLVHG